MEQSFPATDMRDDRKTAVVAAQNRMVKPGARHVETFAQIREILRSPKMRQANVQAGMENAVDPEMVSFFYLDGEEHRRRRASVSHYFTLRAIQSDITRLLPGRWAS